MPLLETIEMLFPERLGPFSMKDIVERLQDMYSPHLSRTAIYNAHNELKQSDATKALVAPLDPFARELIYSAVAAQRIARKAIRNRTPSQIAPRMLPPAPALKMLAA